MPFSFDHEEDWDVNILEIFLEKYDSDHRFQNDDYISSKDIYWQ